MPLKNLLDSHTLRLRVAFIQLICASRKNSNYSFRSSDLGVMSPARYPCAKLLISNFTQVHIVGCGADTKSCIASEWWHHDSIDVLSLV